MLKPEIVAAAVRRVGRARRVETHKRDLHVAEAQHGLLRGGAGQAEQRGQGRVARTTRREPEPQAVAVERHRPVEVRHHPADSYDAGRAAAPPAQRQEADAGQQNQRAESGAHCQATSRSRMRSPTRSALAMMVSVGFTAPMEGKKLASVT